jgi:predicted acyl esterase
MYGKSYDGVTGLIGANHRAPGLAAVVSQEPVYDRYLYNLDGLNDTQRPGCPVLNLTDQAADDDHYSSYWRKRILVPGAKGSDVPLFLTQGLTENNTVADGTAQYWTTTRATSALGSGRGGTSGATRPTRTAA